MLDVTLLSNVKSLLNIICYLNEKTTLNLQLILQGFFFILKAS